MLAVVLGTHDDRELRLGKRIDDDLVDVGAVGVVAAHEACDRPLLLDQRLEL